MPVAVSNCYRSHTGRHKPQAADTYHIRTVKPERRDQKLCKVSPVSAAGASLRALVGRGNQGLDLSSPREGSWWWVRIMLELRNFNLKVWGGARGEDQGKPSKPQGQQSKAPAKSTGRHG